MASRRRCRSSRKWWSRRVEELEACALGVLDKYEHTNVHVVLVVSDGGERLVQAAVARVNTVLLLLLLVIAGDVCGSGSSGDTRLLAAAGCVEYVAVELAAAVEKSGRRRRRGRCVVVSMLLLLLLLVSCMHHVVHVRLLFVGLAFGHSLATIGPTQAE